MIEALNQLLANGSVLYRKIRHFHWNVAGHEFFELHKQFEELYDEFGEYVDTVAERILQLGGKPLPNYASELKISQVQEETTYPKATEMVKILVADLTAERERIGKVEDQADEAGDRTTVNLLDEMHDSLAKHLWMLGAFLK